MTRRLFAIVLALCTLAVAGEAAAQVRNKPLRIYAITFRGMTDVEKGFQDYFASRKIPVEITFRDLNRDNTRMPGFIEEIKRTRPDLVYTWGTSVTLGVVGEYDKVDPAKHVTDIPVVFTLVASPTLAKIVQDRKSSGRNVTGVVHVAPAEAQVQAMNSYRPIKTVGILYTPTEQNSVVVVDEVRKIAAKNNFQVIAKPLRLDANKKVIIDGAAEMVRELKASKADWLYLPPDSFLGTQAKSVIIPAAMEVGLPTFASTEQLMETGALTGLVSRYHSIGQFTAYKVEQILLNRIPPSRIPVETLTRFSLQINLATADSLKLAPPLPMFNYAELLTGNEPPKN
jgi:putative tryptophan/tyrosine transport system substrate-binding protein